MAKVDLSSMALSDVSLIRLVTKGSVKKEYLFTSSTDFEAEEVIQEGEEKPLIIKGVLRANKPAKDTLLGHDIKLIDNLFTPEVLCLLQGGEIEAGEDGKFKKYLPPIVGEDVVKEKFDMEIYSAIIENDGETGDYLKTTYYNCIGQNKPVSFKDDEYFTAEYGIQSRPANGERPYDFEIVTGLPQ